MPQAERKRPAGFCTQKELAEYFNVSVNYIWHMVKREFPNRPRKTLLSPKEVDTLIKKYEC